MPHLQVEKIHGPARRAVTKGLVAFNKKAVGISDYGLLTITLRDGKEIVGGLTGMIWLGWLYVEILWIDGKYRGKRHGTALVRKAESEARKRGIRHVFLNSFSFQAPGFYKKLGYKEFGRLGNLPGGHTRHWLKKTL
jgi:ribosomal protein S18 acetylase RimI-like enzyme